MSDTRTRKSKNFRLMKRLLSLCTLVLVLVLSVFAIPQVAQAQTISCTSISGNPTQWPPANVCSNTTSGSTQPAQAGTVLSTLLGISDSGTDAAIRLQFQISSGDVGTVLSITITDASLSGGSATVSHTVVANDSLVTIGNDLASQIIALPGGNFYGIVNGQALTIYSFSGNTTTYSSSVSDPLSLITITLAASDGDEVATLASGPVTGDTWYDFASHADYYTAGSSSPLPVGGPPSYETGLAADVLGETFIGTGGNTGTRASSIFESTASDGSLSNSIVSHVTAHETGHQLDNIYAPFGDNSLDFSASTAFSNALAQDIIGINSIPPCTADASDRLNGDEGYGVPYASRPGDHGYYASSGSPIPTAGGGLRGFFTGLQDRAGNYICSGTNGSGTTLSTGPGTNYSNFIPSGSGTRSTSLDGSDNTSIIAQAYGGALISAPAELFAEEYSVIANFPDTINNAGSTVPGRDSVFNATGGAFICTSLYVNKLTNYGRVPTSTELSTTSYGVTSTFAGDAYGVTYGPQAPPNLDADNNYAADMHAVTNYNCDGTQTVSTGIFSFGS